MATPAPQLPVFYRDVVALSRERHKGWYIDPEQGYSFAASSNSVYVAASEFVVAAREFPIVFARDAGGGLAPAVLLGLRANENVVVDEEGRWLTNYVPAYVRRYPFILATAAGIDLTRFNLIDGFIVKPYEVEVLCAFVAKHLRPART